MQHNWQPIPNPAPNQVPIQQCPQCHCYRSYPDLGEPDKAHYSQPAGYHPGPQPSLTEPPCKD